MDLRAGGEDVEEPKAGEEEPERREQVPEEPHVTRPGLVEHHVEVRLWIDDAGTSGDVVPVVTPDRVDAVVMDGGGGMGPSHRHRTGGLP